MRIVIFVIFWQVSLLYIMYIYDIITIYIYIFVLVTVNLFFASHFYSFSDFIYSSSPHLLFLECVHSNLVRGLPTILQLFFKQATVKQISLSFFHTVQGSDFHLPTLLLLPSFSVLFCCKSLLKSIIIIFNCVIVY